MPYYSAHKYYIGISDEHQQIENRAFINKARNACFNEFQVECRY